MNRKKAIEIIEKLKEFYPDATCSLDFSTPFEMLVAVMLSAQCTDARVNIVTKEMFKKYNTPQSFASLDLKIIENLIHSCGFYKNKAKNLKDCSKMLLEKFNGEVPNTMEELMSLPGIGRKSANVIMLEAFNSPCGIAIDTHAKRISNRLGLSSKKEPSEIEADLLSLLPKEYYYDVNHLLVWHGRNICSARNPKCNLCPVSYLCKNNV